MKILLVGASGTIGQAVEENLKTNHEVITANYSKGDVQVDLGNPESISNMFKVIGKVDAVISTAGVAAFAGFDDLTDSDYQTALNNKLMGQVNLMRLGKDFRVNVVAPIFVKETMAMMGMDTESGISANDTAKAYIVAVTGDMHGQTLDAPDYL